MVIVGMNDRDQRWHDIYRVDLQSGKRELLLQNEGFSAVYVDNDLQVRLAQEQTESGGANLYTREGEDWEPLMEIAAEDYYTTGIVGFGADNNSFYALDSRGRDTGALVRINIETGEANTLAMSDNADISDALIHPRTHELIDPAARTFLLRVLPQDDAPALVPGMSVKADVQVPAGRDGVVVSRDAIVRYPDGRSVVWVIVEADGITTVGEKRVQQGLQFGGLVEILSGLEGNERVVVRGNEALRAGQPVRITDIASPAV